MKRLGLLAAALAAFAAPVYAVPADELKGTWECRVPGAPPTKTPPIVWFGAADGEGRTLEAAIDLDGFARSVYGISDVVPGAKGWWQVQPQDGASFLVKPLPAMGKAQAVMSLKLGEAAYRCRRLPRLV